MSIADTRALPRRAATEPTRRGAGTMPRVQMSFVDGANALDVAAPPASPPAPSRPSQRPGRPGPQRRTGPTALPRRTQAPVRLVPGTHDQPAPRPRSVARRRARFVLATLVVVAVGVLGVLFLNTKVNENSFRLDDLRARKAAQDLQEQQLSQELAQRQTPGNLAAAARRLGLVPAGTPAYIRLPDGRVVGVPQPATGSSSSGGH